MFDRDCYVPSVDIYPHFSYENKRILIMIAMKLIINNNN